MTKEEQAQSLLNKYLKGEASLQEKAQVEHWYESYAQQEALEKGKKSTISREVWLNLQQAMGQNSVRRVHWHLNVYQLSKIAAVLLLISTAGISYWLLKPSIARDRFFTVKTSATEQKTVVFKDGSTVVMAPLAQLVYPQKFNAKDRTIALREGEAFFSIAHEVNRPFMVKTSNQLYTKVLGTSFRIKSYKNQSHISVQVATGMVAVGNDHQVFGTLIKGQEIAYDKINQRAEIRQVPSEIPVDLKFEQATLNAVLTKLEYVYHIRIILENPAFAGLKCTGYFNTKQTPEEILEIICMLHQLKFRTTDNHKTFNVYRK